MRQFEWLDGSFPGYCPITTIARTGFQYKVMKRATPTILAKTIGGITINTLAGNFTATSLSLNTVSVGGMYLDVNSSGLTAGVPCSINIQVSNLYLDARL